MNFDEIETADCKILSFMKIKNDIKIKFNYLYVVSDKCYCDNMIIVIAEVDGVEICRFNGDEMAVEKVSAIDDYYDFGIEMIQKVNVENNLVTMGCFSINGEWLEVSCQSNNIRVYKQVCF